jgi:hypothetical protein
MTTKRRKRSAVGLTVLFLFTWYGISQAQNKAMPKTQIVLLGTGTPLPDPERSGPATAIVVNGTPYIVDFGTGVVRQAAAARKRGVEALEPVNLKIGFLHAFALRSHDWLPGHYLYAVDHGENGTA